MIKTLTTERPLLWLFVVAGELIGRKAELVDECRRHLLHLVIVKSLQRELVTVVSHVTFFPAR